MTESRTARVERNTNETSIRIKLNLDGTGDSEIATGLGFLDHMLTALARHGHMDLSLQCEGDLEVDDHHTAEDCALALGSAIDQALGTRRGIQRFGWALAPLDEALARVAVDLSGRPHSEVELGLKRPSIGAIGASGSCGASGAGGAMATENIEHFFRSLAVGARMTLHVDLLRGANDHHRAEAAFKATALALRQAVARTCFEDIPSTKGVLVSEAAR